MLLTLSIIVQFILFARKFNSGALGLAVLLELSSILAIVVGSDNLQLLTRLSFSSSLELLKE